MTNLTRLCHRHNHTAYYAVIVPHKKRRSWEDSDRLLKAAYRKSAGRSFRVLRRLALLEPGCRMNDLEAHPKIDKWFLV